MRLVLESCDTKELCTALGGSEELLHELRDKLKHWLKLQAHLPHAALWHKILHKFAERVLGTKQDVGRRVSMIQSYGCIQPLRFFLTPSKSRRRIRMTNILEIPDYPMIRYFGKFLFLLAEDRSLTKHTDVPEERLEWLILSTKAMSLERAKQKLDMYYTLRRLIPEFFQNRDPRGLGITCVYNTIQCAMLPKLGPGLNRTIITRLIEADPSKLRPWDMCKLFFMIADIRMIEGRSFAENYIVDLSMITLSHLMKLTPTLVKKCEIVALRAYATRIKGFHFINAPPFVDRIVGLVKSVLSPKIAAKLQFHVHPVGNLESLYQFMPKSMLPKDYGGEQPTMAELSDALREKIDSWGDWFLEDEKILVDERLRSGPAINGDGLFGFCGSFRKLEID